MAKSKIGFCMLCRKPMLDAEILTHKYGVTIVCRNCNTFNFVRYSGLLR